MKINMKKMEYSDFYDIAEYGNENWKGSFTPKEVAQNAYDYLCEYEETVKQGKETHTIKELLKLLQEDNDNSKNENVSYWIEMLKQYEKLMG